MVRYRVVRTAELIPLPGLTELFTWERTYADMLEAELNRLSAQGWELVSSYGTSRSYQELLIFRRTEDVEFVEPQPPAATAANPRYAAPEPIALPLDYHDPSLPRDSESEELPIDDAVPHSIVVEGDLIKLALQGRFDVIVHGCNCRHTMGGGIARSIKLAFPEAEDADLATPYADRSKLGTISTATIQRNDKVFVVVNAYTQFEPGADVDYDAMRSAFRELKRRFAGKRIGYPRIGAGIGGGDWTTIAAIIDEELAGETHTLVEFRPES